ERRQFVVSVWLGSRNFILHLKRQRRHRAEAPLVARGKYCDSTLVEQDNVALNVAPCALERIQIDLHGGDTPRQPAVLQGIGEIVASARARNADTEECPSAFRERLA